MDSGAPAISASLRGRIIALYGAKLLRKSAMNIRGGAGVFERVMAGKGYRTALEIGTYRGVSAAEMARYCERVITVDALSALVHEEHDTLALPAGTYSVIRQREYTPEGLRDVQD